ncbi:MAG: ubiquitin-like protein UBact [Candidatus Latescibacterota bacterium]
METVELRDRIPRPVKPMEDGGGENEDGPRRPKVDKPGGGDDILKRMKRVDPNQARRYRQRTGQ